MKVDVKKTLSNNIRKKIFMAIHDHDSKINFNSLLSKVELRSNDLSYHLKILLSSGLIKKEQDGDNSFYSLSGEGKTIYPYLSIITENIEPLLVITSVALIDGNHLYLQKKPREPEKGKNIFFGGKVLSDKLIEDSAREHVERQAGCKVNDLKLRCVNEFMKKEEDKVIFHGVIYFYTAIPVGKVKDGIVEKELDSIRPEELMWDNGIFVKEMLDNETPKVIRTIL